MTGAKWPSKKVADPRNGIQNPEADILLSVIGGARNVADHVSLPGYRVGL
jgi:hypothetical protein